MAVTYPEARLIEGELTLRDMQLTKDVRMTKPSLIRWLALAMGLISPNESRNSVLAVFDALLYFQLGERRDPDIHELLEYNRRLHRNVGDKCVRYHLLQLKNMGLIERKKGRYRFVTSPLSEKGDIIGTIDYVFKRRADLSISKIKEAMRELQESYRSGAGAELV